MPPSHTIGLPLTLLSLTLGLILDHRPASTTCVTSAIVTSQSLPLFMPVLRRLAASQSPVVFYVPAREVDAEDLTTRTDFSGVFAVRDSNATIVVAHSVQELHDLAVALHCAAPRLGGPVILTFSDRVARTSEPWRSTPFGPAVAAR